MSSTSATRSPRPAPPRSAVPRVGLGRPSSVVAGALLSDAPASPSSTAIVQPPSSSAAAAVAATAARAGRLDNVDHRVVAAAAGHVVPVVRAGHAVTLPGHLAVGVDGAAGVAGVQVVVREGVADGPGEGAAGD